MSSLRSFAFVAALSTIFATASVTATAQTKQANRTPVLVELFTSEGCSSCPPADALLGKLDHDQPVSSAEVIVLGEHVDYWDELGWHDRFSSHQYTDRQTQYSTRLNAEVYTPQMIVDGTDRFVGNDVQHALRAIQHAAQTPKIKFTISHPIVDGRKVSASISLPVTSETEKPADLYAALVDPTDVTEIKAGENGGRRIQHAGVVRSLQRIGSLKDLRSGPVSFHLSAPDDAKPSAMRLVVFAQKSGPGSVIGITSIAVNP